MRGRPNIHVNNDLIIKTQEVFWQKGYNGTSLSDLSVATGAGAGSLYNTFKGGKKELFKRSLEQRREVFFAFKDSIKESENPIKQIKQFFLDIGETNDSWHQKGCIVANTLVEMTFVDNELKDDAIKILTETEEFYRTIIAQEQEKGKLKTKIPADVLAKYLISFWCGINSLRRMYPDNKILKTQINLQLEILK
ncbi:TetR/AcrR family transcriptional regulator [Chryseobacterium kwangjuense]|uniref:TetR family transcriptional regulator n=1 Tax=Chryseobacterium kwangjuense TaxID=267125 RepID=A0A135WIC8_9FLAO|nr:TetR/AcrR family transcriptional regulator [Chryseobacterium kwangjuense]KXH84651.1 TetR family transcriptional regulator [Chryseobacterium kwangjuense]